MDEENKDSNIQEASPEEIQELINSGNLPINKVSHVSADMVSIENKSDDPTITLSDEDLKAVGIDKDELKAIAEKEKKEDIADAIKAISEEKEKNRVSLSPDPRIIQQASFFASANNFALYDVSKVKISDEEKELFVRCTLINSLFNTNVSLAKGKYNINFISKTIAVQNLINNFIKDLAMEMDVENKRSKYTTEEALLLYLQMHILVSITAINGKDTFGYANLILFLNDITKSYEEKKSYLLNAIKNTLDKLPRSTWFLIWNAARIFEQKETLLNEFVLNEDF